MPHVTCPTCKGEGKNYCPECDCDEPCQKCQGVGGWWVDGGSGP